MRFGAHMCIYVCICTRIIATSAESKLISGCVFDCAGGETIADTEF